MLALLRMAGLSAVALLAAAPVQAAVIICRHPGVGYGAPGGGVRPAAGPGVGPNYGGPANYQPAAGPGAGGNGGGPVNRAGWR